MLSQLNLSTYFISQMVITSNLLPGIAPRVFIAHWALNIKTIVHSGHCPDRVAKELGECSHVCHLPPCGWDCPPMKPHAIPHCRTFSMQSTGERQCLMLATVSRSFCPHRHAPPPSDRAAPTRFSHKTADQFSSREISTFGNILKLYLVKV